MTGQNSGTIRTGLFGQLILAMASVAATLVMFSPHLWLMRHEVPEAFQWHRALTFLAQCAEPFRSDVEPAMRWRVLPPIVSSTLHLRGYFPLILPWLGVLFLTGYVSNLLAKRISNWRYILGGTLLITTTSAVLVPIGWLGINDAWVWVGLLVIAFGRSRMALILASLLCPWVDERFLIGFPLAWLVRQAESEHAFSPREVLSWIWLLPYGIIRIVLASTLVHDEASVHFLKHAVTEASAYAAFAPFGWWMGLRVGWLLAIYALIKVGWIERGLLLTVAGATLLTMMLVASDLSRSVAILVPLVLLGCFRVAREFGSSASQIMLRLGVANLLIPAAHVIYTKIDVISPLPIELFRLFRTQQHSISLALPAEHCRFSGGYSSIE